MSRKNLIVFASGSGSNAEKIIEYFNDGSLAKVSLIVTNNPCAKVIDRAQNHGVDHWVIGKSDLSDSKFIEKLNSVNPNLIVLAGFLLKIPEEFIRAFEGIIINIHPSLLPKFGGKGMYGRHVHEAVISAGEKISGISIHFVNESYDEGKIISQFSCAVKENDDPDSLASRIHSLEHEHYPKTIEKLLLNGSV